MITGYKSSSFGSVGWPINIGKGTRIMGGKSFRLGDNVTFGVDSVLETFCQYGHQRFNPIVKIGNNCSFGDYTHITCINSITIGDNLLTGRRVLISDNSHGESMIMTNKNEMGGGNTLSDRKIAPIRRNLSSKGPIVIGDNVWIGDNVCILSGVKIGNGAIIGANTVVNKDVPAFSIAVGAKLKILTPQNMDS